MKCWFIHVPCREELHTSIGNFILCDQYYWRMKKNSMHHCTLFKHKIPKPLYPTHMHRHDTTRILFVHAYNKSCLRWRTIHPISHSNFVSWKHLRPPANMFLYLLDLLCLLINMLAPPVDILYIFYQHLCNSQETYLIISISLGGVIIPHYQLREAININSNVLSMLKTPTDKL